MPSPSRWASISRSLDRWNLKGKGPHDLREAFLLPAAYVGINDRTRRPSPDLRIVTEPNPNARLEAFSNGVFAMALTLLVIDIRLPLYSVLALAASGFPVAVAIVTTLSWIFWLTISIRMNASE
jgi:hypothetical protein